MPSPSEIRAARERAGLTQAQASELLGATRIAWTRYEAGTRALNPALWQLWLHLAGLERIPFVRQR